MSTTIQNNSPVTPNTAAIPSLNIPSYNCKCSSYDLQWQNKFQLSTLIGYCGCVTSRQLTTNKLLCFRIFSAIYSSCILIWNLIRFIRRGMSVYWLIYITQWGAIIVTLYFIIICIINIKILRYINIHITSTPSLSINNIIIKPNGILSTDTNIDVFYNKNSTLRSLCKLCSILYSISFASNIVITLTNWTLVTDYSRYLKGPGDIEKMMNDIHMHGVLTLLIGIDYSVSMLYLTYSSIIYPLIFIAVYVVWSLIHFALKLTNPWHEPYIYPMLNWKYPQTAIPVVFALALCTAFVHCLLAWIKYKYILNKWLIKQKHVENIANVMNIEAETHDNNAISPNDDVDADVPSNITNLSNPSTSHVVSSEMQEHDSKPPIHEHLEENKVNNTQDSVDGDMYGDKNDKLNTILHSPMSSYSEQEAV